MESNDPKHQHKNEHKNEHQHGHKHGGCGKHECGCSHGEKKSEHAAENKPRLTPVEPEAVTDPAQQQQGAEAAPAAESNTLALQLEIAQLKAQRDELQQKVLRSIAEYQTLARRSYAEVADARAQENFEAAQKLVEILDEFDRVMAVDPQKVTIENLRKGVELVHARFLQLFSRMGVKRVEAKPGDDFDPKLHEALMQQPAPENVKSNQVVMQLMPGYVMGEKTVRPVKVSVAQ